MNVTALNVTVDRDGTRLHRLVDDVIHPVRASRAIARRDPLVEALFGAPKARHPKAGSSARPRARSAPASRE